MKKNSSQNNIDVLISEMILGNVVIEHPTDGLMEVIDQASAWHIPLPNYSSNISDAWKLIETLGGVWDIGNEPDGWRIRWAMKSNPWSDRIITVNAPTAAMGICLAVLQMNNINYE